MVALLEEQLFHLAHDARRILLMVIVKACGPPRPFVRRGAGRLPGLWVAGAGGIHRPIRPDTSAVCAPAIVPVSRCALRAVPCA